MEAPELSEPLNAVSSVAQPVGVPPPPVISVTLAALSASFTGWKYVVPPEEQLPEPPEVMPWACVPASSEPPESPGSAHTLVRIRPETVPWE